MSNTIAFDTNITVIWSYTFAITWQRQGNMTSSNSKILSDRYTCIYHTERVCNLAYNIASSSKIF